MKTIAVIGLREAGAGTARLLAGLGRAFGFETVDAEGPEGVRADGWLVLRSTPALCDAVARTGVPALHVAAADPLAALDPARLESAGEVRFTPGLGVADVFDGRHVVGEATPLVALAALAPGQQAVALRGGRPFWAVDAARRQHMVATPLPSLEPGEPLYAHFSQDHFLALLPLVCMVRAVVDEPGWTPPPLQATFMFDDPNLHWGTYGYIDFARLAAHAREHRYHVCSATIPLDAWYVHAGAAALFRAHAAELSLLIHGNDHVNEELARSGARTAALDQALRRIGRLEDRSGVPVARVMAPPHGACSEAALAAMAALGYDAACISRGSLHHFNRGAAWTAGIGLRPADRVAGLTVLPRFRISATCHNAILLAALLRQPIVPVGHHQDVAAGLGLFADLAAFINGLGPVRWAGMGDIVRGHHAQRTRGGCLDVRLWTGRATLPIPDGIDTVRVHRPWLADPLDEPLWRGAARDAGRVLAGVTDPRRPIAVRPGEAIELVSGPAPQPLPASARTRRLRAWPVVRRVLTEVRDRLAPAIHRYGESN